MSPLATRPKRAGTLGVVFNKNPRARHCWVLRALSARAHPLRGPVRGGPRFFIRY